MAAGSSSCTAMSAAGGWRDPLAQTLTSRETGERVPGAVAPQIMPFVRAADEFERHNQRVAFLCRKFAVKKLEEVDPTSRHRGVRQYKTNMSKLVKDETPDDANVIKQFYKEYCANMSEISQKKNFEEMARYYQMAYALYDVLLDVTDNDVDSEVLQWKQIIDENGQHFKNYTYNIIPLNFQGSSETIVQLTEILDVVAAIRKIDGLPMPQDHVHVRDVFDWLSLAFGFQKSNIENQREHMVLVLANISTRTVEEEGHPLVLTVNEMWEKIFANYKSWCLYLHISSNIMMVHDLPEDKKRQRKLMYIGLYLLIWGEASNIRFMPECLCYIFHNMAKVVHDMLHLDYFRPPQGFEEEGNFLQIVIEPIFKVLQIETRTMPEMLISDAAICDTETKRVTDINW